MSVMNAPLVTVVTPTYNSSKYITATVNSVIAQSETNWEMIVVDDCSCDDTRDVVLAIAASDRRVRLIEMDTNEGAAVARNTAIYAARGRYISFLDADDLWRPHKLQTQLAFMQKHEADLSFTAYEIIDDDGHLIGDSTVPERVTYEQLLRSNVIGCQTAIYDTKRLGLVEMPLIRKRQDFGLWLKILRRTQYAYGLQEKLSCYRLRPGSISYNKISTIKYTWQLYREFEDMSRHRTAYYISSHLSKALLRRLRNRMK